MRLNLIAISVIITSCFFGATCGTPPEEEWCNTFGRSGDNTFSKPADDAGYSVQQTLDGGYVITGWSEGSGGKDVWLIKTNSDGDKEWAKTFSGSSDDVGESGQETSDGGYILAAYTESYSSGGQDAWLIKTDRKGKMEWSETFGGPADDQAKWVQETSDGCYVIAGYTESSGAGDKDAWLIKTDSKGNLEWEKTFGGSTEDVGYCVQQTRDGGYIITGYTKSYGEGDFDVWLIKTDSYGNLEWDKTFGGSNPDYGKSVRETRDGGYITSGFTRSYGVGDFDAWLIKTDSNGDEVWNKTFGEAAADAGQSVIEAEDGGYVVVGMKQQFREVNPPLFQKADQDLYVVKTDSRGDVTWTKTFGEMGEDVGYSVQQTLDGGYIVAGLTGSYGAGKGKTDVWLIKIRPE